MELIQSVINRMANNSFYIKGWCVTIVAAILGLISKDINKRLFAVVYFPILMFWILDSFFLHQEKLFRTLYDSVRILDEDKIDFSMTPSQTDRENNKWIDNFFSSTLLLFYGIMALVTCVAIAILHDWI